MKMRIDGRLQNIEELLKAIDKNLDTRATKKWYSLKEASVYTSVSVSTLRRAVKKGELKIAPPKRPGSKPVAASNIFLWYPARSPQDKSFNAPT